MRCIEPPAASRPAGLQSLTPSRRHAVALLRAALASRGTALAIPPRRAWLGAPLQCRSGRCPDRLSCQHPAFPGGARPRALPVATCVAQELTGCTGSATPADPCGPPAPLGDDDGNRLVLWSSFASPLRGDAARCACLQGDGLRHPPPRLAWRPLQGRTGRCPDRLPCQRPAFPGGARPRALPFAACPVRGPSLELCATRYEGWRVHRLRSVPIGNAFRAVAVNTVRPVAPLARAVFSGRWLVMCPGPPPAAPQRGLLRPGVAWSQGSSSTRCGYGVRGAAVWPCGACCYRSPPPSPRGGVILLFGWS